MKDFIGKIFTRDVSIVLLIAIFSFGMLKYVEYRINLVSKENKLENILVLAKNNELQKRLTEVERKMGGTLSYLSQEDASKQALENQVSQVASTVGVLSKLSKTDPELLKKYSKIYFLNEHYVPISLSKIDVGYVSKNSTKDEIHSNVLPYLEKMIDAGRVDKVDILVQSAFRSFADQAMLKSKYKVVYGAGTANSFSADQGYSEHQLGTAMDLTTGKTNGALEGFDKTPEYEWLANNAYKYGFILSYPKGNGYYIYEPWHWRFVGVSLATYLHNNNLNFYSVDQRTIDGYLANIFD